MLPHRPSFLSRHVLGSGGADPLGSYVGDAYTRGNKACAEAFHRSLQFTNLRLIRVFEYGVCGPVLDVRHVPNTPSPTIRHREGQLPIGRVDILVPDDADRSTKAAHTHTNLHGAWPTLPFSASDCHHAPWLIDELVPSLAAVVDDVVAGCGYPARQPVVVHELPNVLNRVALGALSGQCDGADVGELVELAGLVPSGLIHQDDGMGPRRNSEGYFGQLQRHGFGVAEGQNERGSLAKFEAECAIDLGRFRPLVLRRRGPCPAPCPTPRDLVLLADAGFVLEPDLYRRALLEGGSDFCQLGS